MVNEEQNNVAMYGRGRQGLFGKALEDRDLHGRVGEGRIVRVREGGGRRVRNMVWSGLSSGCGVWNRVW